MGWGPGGWVQETTKERARDGGRQSPSQNQPPTQSTGRKPCSEKALSKISRWNIDSLETKLDFETNNEVQINTLTMVQEKDTPLKNGEM